MRDFFEQVAIGGWRLGPGRGCCGSGRRRPRRWAGATRFRPRAASYGLKNPFDPAEATDAQAHLTSDLIRQLGSPQLALAAYNAGPAPVEACHCVPSIPETTAYVSRIMALLGGAGALAVPSFEVRLVA